MKMEMGVRDIISYLRDTKKKTLKNGIDWGCKIGGKHITILHIEELGFYQIGLHNIQGDVVFTELEFWVNDKWEEVEDFEKPPVMWYFPSYIDEVVREETTWKSSII